MIQVDYTGHITTLCATHGITVEVIGLHEARAQYKSMGSTRYAQLPFAAWCYPVTDQRRHAYHREVEAWNWAQTHALCWTPIQTQLREQRLQAYRREWC